VRPRRSFPFRSTVAAMAFVATWTTHADEPVDDAFFERFVRPLLVERCHECHSGEAANGGLRLDSRAALLQGGESGPAVDPGIPAGETLLVRAIEQRDGLEMPPDGKLPSDDVARIVAWVAAGAPWPGDAPSAPPPAPRPRVAAPLAPDSAALAARLQFWLRADLLALDDGAPVPVWPDASGHGRDASVTAGIRPDGRGAAGRFVRESTLGRRPAVRFTNDTGYASSPGVPLPLSGDAAFTLVAVVNLAPHDVGNPHDGILGFGDPANPGADPGLPMAAILQINRAEDHALHVAGGWNHDASLGAGSFRPLYGRPTLLVAVKEPGPMRAATRVFVDGVPAAVVEGRDTVPAIRHRADIGVFLGRALSWSGSITGDVGEALVFDAALADREREGLEAWLGDKYALPLGGPHRVPPPTYSPAERAHWAYRPIADPPPPPVRRPEACLTSIDRFVDARLDALGLDPAPPADRGTLLRRATFTLTGLPPTPAELAAFLSDDSPEAFARVVDRLLASPAYGEHQARQWLDVVRFAETTANDANAVMTQAWRYRDWVVGAFNADLPWGDFLVCQLAGDLLPPSGDAATDAARTVATGYLMVGPKALAETDKEQSRLDIVDDQIDVTGRAMLGLTLACARCHDHKFDAVRASDYYALAGIFRSTEPFQNEVRNATMWQEFPVPAGDGGDPITVMAPKEALPRDLRIHLRGSRFQLGEIAPREVPGVFRGAPAGAEEDPRPFVASGGSGRLELARWIARPDHPLTPRVVVNRIWQQHFGRGLVATGDDFGTRGEPPTHPELLDWLARRFLDDRMSVKALHRRILASATFRRSSAASPELRAADPDHRWLGAWRRRRLAAEQQRDAILAASGGLDREPGGDTSARILVEKAEDIGAMIKPNRLAADDPCYTTITKRALYLPQVRNMLPDVLALFDAADPNGVTARRNETTVASQALFLLNSPFVTAEAGRFARSLLEAPGLDDGGRVDLASRRALGRPATPDEIAEALAFVAAAAVAGADDAATGRQAAWQAWCRTLLCSAEFAFLE